MKPFFNSKKKVIYKRCFNYIKCSILVESVFVIVAKPNNLFSLCSYEKVSTFKYVYFYVVKNYKYK